MTDLPDTGEPKPLLSGRRAQWAILIGMQLVTFFSMVAISPSWMGIFDTHFIGPWGSTAVAQLLPFLADGRTRGYYAAAYAQAEAERVALLRQTKEFEGIIRDLSKSPSSDSPGGTR